MKSRNLDVGSLELTRINTAPAELRCTHADPVVTITDEFVREMARPNPWVTVDGPIASGAVLRMTLTNGTWVYVLREFVPAEGVWIAQWPD